MLFTPENYTLSLHDALPISSEPSTRLSRVVPHEACFCTSTSGMPYLANMQKQRSEEHTSELQSRLHVVCRLLLEKKKKHSFFYRYFLIDIFKEHVYLSVSYA